MTISLVAPFAAPRHNPPQDFVAKSIRDYFEYRAAEAVLALGELSDGSSHRRFFEENFELVDRATALNPGLGIQTRNDTASLLQFFLLLAAEGGQGHFEFSGIEHAAPYFATYRLPLSGRISATCNGDSVSVSDASATHRFRLHPGGAWLLDSDSVRASEHGVCLMNCADATYIDKAFVDALPLSTSPRARIFESVRAMFEAIERYAPAYVPWVIKVLRGVVLVDIDGGTVSGSSPRAPGLIFVSHPIDVDNLASLVIHECTHQYFYLLERKVPLVIEGFSKQYWSPFRKRPRPLQKVLLALHASVNIRAYTEGAIRAGNHGAYVIDWEEKLTEGIGQMASSISDSEGLTEAGRLFLQATLAAASNMEVRK